MNFLGDNCYRIVKLDRILGIGGEGLVLKDKVDMTHKEYDTEILEEKKEVAVKYIEFKKKKNENFNALEELNEEGDWGGISEKGSPVKSPYFYKLRHNLGAFKVATNKKGGYVTPFLDFGISEIHKKHYFVIGELRHLV